MVCLRGQRGAAVAGDEQDRGTPLAGGAGRFQQALAAAGVRDEQQGVPLGQGGGKGSGPAGHGAGHTALAQAAELERRIHGHGQAVVGGFDFDQLRAAQDTHRLPQLAQIECLDGGAHLFLPVGLHRLQGLPQGVRTGGALGLRLLLVHHIPRECQLEFAVVVKAELVAQPGDGGFRGLAGAGKLGRGDHRRPFHIVEDAVCNAPFRAVKLDARTQQRDDASRRIAHRRYLPTSMKRFQWSFFLV